MSVVFDLADRISVLVYGEIIASDAPREDPRQPGGAGSLSRNGGHERDARGRATCTPITARATSCRASTFDVGEGEIVSILGRNGVGRSTTIKAIMGDVPPQGAIVFKGEPIAGLKSYRDRAPRARLRAGEPRHLPDR